MKEFNLHSIETILWVKILIESRNSVAHGRRVYYDKAIYPVKPFYPLITNELYPLEFLRIFIAKVICSHLDISLFDDKWNEIKESFIPDEFTTKEFINGTPKEVSKLSEQEEKNIFGGLNYFIVTKKIQAEDSKNVYEFYLKTEIDNEDFLSSNIDAIVLLYESNASDIDELLKTAIINTHKNDCNPHYKFRDMMYYLDFHNFKTPRLEDLLINNEVR